MTTTPTAEWFLTDVDLRHNKLINAAPESRSTPPANPVKGQLYMDDSVTPSVLKYYNGTSWTSGSTFYSTVADDGVDKPQHNRLNFRSTTSVDAAVSDEGSADTSSVTMSAKYGEVTPSVIPGEQADSGTAATLARSDHTHGSPSSVGADTVMVSWWQYDQQLWDQLTAATSFLANLPGDVVGGGWAITAPGSVYWTGSPAPISRESIYRNSVRVSTLNGTAAVTAGWRCFDADLNYLGQVKCINAAEIEQGTESGVLVARNYVTNPSGEGPAFGGDGWNSNGFFGTASMATVSQTSERVSSGTYAVKTIWPNLTSGTIQSSCVIRVDGLTPGTQMTVSAKVFVPTGSPDVQLDCVFFAISPAIRTKNAWVDVSLPFTVPSGTGGGVYVGLTCMAPVAGTVAYIDDVMVRAGTTPLPDGRVYFDGDTVSTETAIFTWDGDPDDSTSSYYTLEPSWEAIDGYIGVGDGAEPALGEVADVGDAVDPIPGSVFFQPYVAAAGGIVLLDTHEVARGPRDITVVDGLTTGWVSAANTMTAAEVNTTEVSPPDTEPPSYLRVGPLVDPPMLSGDAVPRSFVERLLGGYGLQTNGDLAPLPPQFLFSSTTGSDPIPADLGFVFDAWPLWSLWLDTSIKQARPTMVVGTAQTTTGQVLPLVTSFTQLPAAYTVVLTPPVDGLLLAVSTGSVYAQYDDYVEMRCSVFAGTDASGDGGTSGGYAGEQIHSGSTNTTNNRAGYTLFNATGAIGGTTYKACTMYNHGGAGSAKTNRDRVFVLFLPGVKVSS